VNTTDKTIDHLPHSVTVEMSGQCDVTALQQLADAVDSIVSGQIVLATSAKKSFLDEIASFCGFTGHELVHNETRGNKLHLWIRKGQ